MTPRTEAGRALLAVFDNTTARLGLHDIMATNIADVEREAAALDVERVELVLASMYHTPIGVVSDEVKASATMFVNRYARLAAEPSDSLQELYDRLPPEKQRLVDEASRIPEGAGPPSPRAEPSE